MLTKVHIALLLSVLISTAGVISCTSAKSGDRLIGRWQQVGGQRIVEEFKPDGTFVTSSIEAPDPVTGKYEFVSENSLKITEVHVGGRVESALFRVEFSEDGKKMRVASDSGFLATFERLE